MMLRASKLRSCGTLKSALACSSDAWSHVGRGASDSPEVLAAYVKAIRWRSATAADRDLLQAPFRAGIRLDAYQLLPLRKATKFLCLKYRKRTFTVFQNRAVAMQAQPIVAYCRVSTRKQAKSGLGLSAQQDALGRFAVANGFQVAATFTEVETGKGADALNRARSLPPL